MASLDDVSIVSVDHWKPNDYIACSPFRERLGEKTPGWFRREWKCGMCPESPPARNFWGAAYRHS
jgi:hypothetical protein